MLVAQASNIDDNKRVQVYVRLLNEGVLTYRPVPAVELGQGIFLLEGDEIYDIEDEEWEFPPGEKISAELRSLDGEIVLVAVKPV